MHEGKPAVVKRFIKEDDRREILNYRILQRHGIPTIKTFSLGTDSLVMEDINALEDWRLGLEGDIADAEVARGLANWYFTFHEAGTDVPELHTLYFEFDSITEFDKVNYAILADDYFGHMERSDIDKNPIHFRS